MATPRPPGATIGDFTTPSEFEAYEALRMGLDNKWEIRAGPQRT